jgi:DNA-binding protein YbaB
MGGFDTRQFQEMLQQAQKQAQELQDRMQQTVVEASAGGGTVAVKMNGRKQVLAVRIAVNAAGQKVDEAMQSTVGGMLGGLGLPGL